MALSLRNNLAASYDINNIESFFIF